MPLPRPHESTRSLRALVLGASLGGLTLSACAPGATGDGGTGGLDETGESGETSDTGGEDFGVCEGTKSETPTTFELDVSNWPVAFDPYGPTAQQILTCTLPAPPDGEPGVAGSASYAFNCEDGTASGVVVIHVMGLDESLVTDLAQLSSAASFELELFAGGESGGDVAIRPRELGGAYEEFILRDADGLLLGGFARTSRFRPGVWAPLQLDHASLCTLPDEDPLGVPHREGGLRVVGETPADDLVLRAGDREIWTAEDGQLFMVHAGKADTWGCCHGGFSNDGLLLRLPAG